MPLVTVSYRNELVASQLPSNEYVSTEAEEPPSTPGEDTAQCLVGGVDP
jgi:hypothetical protein